LNFDQVNLLVFIQYTIYFILAKFQKYANNHIVYAKKWEPNNLVDADDGIYTKFKSKFKTSNYNLYSLQCAVNNIKLGTFLKTVDCHSSVYRYFITCKSEECSVKHLI